MRERKAENTSMHIAQVVQDKNYLRTMRTFQVIFADIFNIYWQNICLPCVVTATISLDCRFTLYAQENFDSSHRQLLETLNAYATVEAEPHLTNLCSRLDFNGYFARLYETGAEARGAGGGAGGTQRGLVSSVYRQT